MFLAITDLSSSRTFNSPYSFSAILAGSDLHLVRIRFRFNIDFSSIFLSLLCTDLESPSPCEFSSLLNNRSEFPLSRSVLSSSSPVLSLVIGELRYRLQYKDDRFGADLHLVRMRAFIGGDGTEDATTGSLVLRRSLHLRLRFRREIQRSMIFV